MSIPQNNEINRVHCVKCKEYKLLNEPWHIVKKKGKFGDIISFKGVCPDCKTSQIKKLSNGLLKPEAKEVFSSYSYGEYKLDSNGNIQNKDGGILPLLPLLGLVFTGIGAASGVAGTTAGIVLGIKKNEEEERANRLLYEQQEAKNKAELEEERRKNDELIKAVREKEMSYDKTVDILNGSGIEKKDVEEIHKKILNIDPLVKVQAFHDIQVLGIKQQNEELRKYLDGEGSHMELLSLFTPTIRTIVKDVLKDEIENSIELLPKLMQRPEMQKYIKEKVNEFKSGSGINDEELTEQEQIQEAIDFLEGKGFKFL